MDGKVTADLVESNGILPSGLWLNHLHGRPATTTAVVLKARGLRRHWQRVIKTRYINVVKLRISHQWRSISNSGKNQSSQKVSRSSWQWSRSSKNLTVTFQLWPTHGYSTTLHSSHWVVGGKHTQPTRRMNRVVLHCNEKSLYKSERVWIRSVQHTACQAFLSARPWGLPNFVKI